MAETATSNFKPEGDAPAPETQESEVPEKFRNEDGSVNTGALLKSFLELEKRQHQPAPPQTPPVQGDGPPQKPGEGGDLLRPEELTPFVHEFYNTGRLSDASYRRLEKERGWSKEFTDSVIGGEKAKMDVYWGELISAADGRQEYESLTSWAQANLSPEQVEHYAARIQGMDRGSALSAIEELKARRSGAAAGPAAGMLEGGPAPTGPAPFRSEAEIHEEMHKLVQDPRDPTKTRFRYDVDDAYRRTVDARAYAFRKSQMQRQ